MHYQPNIIGDFKMSAALNKKATLSRITENGLGYLVDQADHRVLAFTFDKIPGYHGQTREKLGLKPGQVVDYDTDDEGYVAEVILG